MNYSLTKYTWEVERVWLRGGGGMIEVRETAGVGGSGRTSSFTFFTTILKAHKRLLQNGSDLTLNLRGRGIPKYFRRGFSDDLIL